MQLSNVPQFAGIHGHKTEDRHPPYHISEIVIGSPI